MIIFRYVRWKNLLSTGNYYTEINLYNNSNTLVVGENGAGKSTLMNVLYVLYGADEGEILLNGTAGLSTPSRLMSPSRWMRVVGMAIPKRYDAAMVAGAAAAQSSMKNLPGSITAAAAATIRTAATAITAE